MEVTKANFNYQPKHLKQEVSTNELRNLKAPLLLSRFPHDYENIPPIQLSKATWPWMCFTVH